MNTKFLLLGALALGGAMFLGGGGKTKTITVTKKIPVPVKLPDMGEYHTQEEKPIKKTVVYNFKFPDITTPSLPSPPQAPSLSDFVQHVFPTFTADPNVHVKFTPTLNDSSAPKNVEFQDSGAKEGYQTSPYVKKAVNKVAQEHPNKAVIVHSQPVVIPKKKLPDLYFS